MTGVAWRSAVVHGYCLRATTRAQLVEVLRRLIRRAGGFRRCIRCNGLLGRSTGGHADRLRTATYYDEFHQCRACGQVYWKGAHTT